MQEGSASPSSTQRDSLTSSLLQAMGCQHELGCFQGLGGFSLKYLLLKAFDFLNLLEHWELLGVAAWFAGFGFGSGHHFHFVLLCGDKLLPFFNSFCFFSYTGVAVRLGGSRLICLGLEFWTQLPF